jgi:hypothetical protein
LDTKTTFGGAVYYVKVHERGTISSSIGSRSRRGIKKCGQEAQNEPTSDQSKPRTIPTTRRNGVVQQGKEVDN